jgi:hypothetical protein
MIVQYKKEKTDSQHRAFGTLLAKNCYVLTMDNEEIGRYYLLQNAHYFTYWDETGTIHTGLVDLWKKTIRCSIWGGKVLTIQTAITKNKTLQVKIADIATVNIVSSEIEAGHKCMYQLCSDATEPIFNIFHESTKINTYQTNELGTIHCVNNNIAMLFSSFLLLQLTFTIAE